MIETEVGHARNKQTGKQVGGWVGRWVGGWVVRIDCALGAG